MPAKNVPLIQRPSLLVCHEKQGDRYFYIPDTDALFKTALIILGERLTQGFWYDPADDPQLRTVLVEGNGMAAWQALRARSNYEYEGVSIARLETV